LHFGPLRLDRLFLPDELVIGHALSARTVSTIAGNEQHLFVLMSSSPCAIRRDALTIHHSRAAARSSTTEATETTTTTATAETAAAKSATEAAPTDRPPDHPDQPLEFHAEWAGGLTPPASSTLTMMKR
jgi:hypothetical protein